MILIVFDDLRENSSTAKFLSEELKAELDCPVITNLYCLPSPLSFFCERNDITDYQSLRNYMFSLVNPVILIDWQMPVPNFIFPNEIAHEDNDGLDLLFLIRSSFHLPNSYIYSQFPYHHTKLKNNQRLTEEFFRKLPEMWLDKATLTGKNLTQKLARKY